MRRRPVTTICSGLLILIAAAYTGGWFWLADTVHASIDQARRDAESRGIAIRDLEPTVTGYPLGMFVDAADFTVVDPAGLEWQGGPLSAGVSVWSPTTARLDLAGPQRLTLAQPVGVPPVEIAILDGTAEATATLDGTVEEGQVALDDVQIDGMPVGRLTIDTVEVAASQSAPENEPLVTTLGAALHAIAMQRTLVPQFGPAIEEARLNAILLGPPPPALRAPFLAAWRDAGGSLRIERMSVDWGPVSVRLAGDVTLDDALQPRADLDIEVYGHQVLVEAITQAGLLQGTEAVLFGFGLGAFVQPDEQGVHRLHTTLRMSNRRLQVGSLPVPVQLPPVVWPE